jgi:hypothetical protein
METNNRVISIANWVLHKLKKVVDENDELMNIRKRVIVILIIRVFYKLSKLIMT